MAAAVVAVTVIQRSLYNDAVKLVKRAGKLEKKEKDRKSKKTLFSSIQKTRESL